MVFKNILFVFVFVFFTGCSYFSGSDSIDSAQLDSTEIADNEIINTETLDMEDSQSLVIEDVFDDQLDDDNQFNLDSDSTDISSIPESIDNNKGFFGRILAFFFGSNTVENDNAMNSEEAVSDNMPMSDDIDMVEIENSTENNIVSNNEKITDGEDITEGDIGGDSIETASGSYVQNNYSKMISGRAFSLLTENITAVDGYIVNPTQQTDEINIPLIIDVVPLFTDTMSYVVSLENGIKPAVRSKFVTKRLIRTKDIRNFAVYLGTDLIVMKEVFNPDDKNYIYDIVFANIHDPTELNVWNLDVESVTPLEISLRDPFVEENTLSVQDILGDKKLGDDGNVYTSENELIPSLTSLDIYKQIYVGRVKSMVGLWKDVTTGEIVEIHEISGEGLVNRRRYAAFVYDNSILPPLRINKELQWNSGDLRFMTSIVSDHSGYYIDEEKMLVKAKIDINEGKAAIILSLPNRVTKYYIPYSVDGDINSETEDLVYSDLKTSLKNIDTTHDYDIMSRYDKNMTEDRSIVDYFVEYPLFFSFFTIFGVLMALPIIG